MNGAIDLPRLREALSYTLSPDKQMRTEAEKYLAAMQHKPGYGLMLIQIMKEGRGASQAPTDQVAAVTFKNLVKKCWEPDEDTKENAIPVSDKDQVKTHIVDLMCTTTPSVQSQVSEALTQISNHDFPAKWENLLPELVSKCNSKDWSIIYGVLLTANSIMKRFRYVFKSDALYRELKYCLENFQQPLLGLFKFASESIVQAGNNKPVLEQILQSARLMCRVFFSLNWQDIPEFFEDNLSEFMSHFAMFLKYSNNLLVDEDEDEKPGVIEQVQAAAIENLILYSDKYLDELGMERLQTFTQLIWNLATKVSTKPKDDVLATTCIKFLTSVVSQASNRKMFEDENTLSQICHSIVIPNISVREEDEELFEDNPLDYIRRDIEGSDSDTRRRGACDLVRGLGKFFQQPVTKICQGIIASLLQQYSQNPQGQWKAKDAALNLMMALSVRAQTKAQGATQINELVNVGEFFESHVLPELSATDVNARPIVKADAIKFVSVLRSQLPISALNGLMPLLVALMKAQQFVIHTYAAACIERMLTVKDASTGRYKVGQQELRPYLEPIFTSAFSLLEQPNYPENDYVMRTVMRIMNVAKEEDLAGVAAVATQKLTAILGKICANPSNPAFSHYLFEAISVLVRNVCRADCSAVDRFESLLFPPFQTVLSMDVEPLAPYVFQVLAQLLETRGGSGASRGLSPAFSALLPPMLAPDLWQRRANVPAMARLMVAYTAQARPEELSPYIQGILGVFQKLVASKATEKEGLELLRGICANIPLASLQPYLKDLVGILLTRLQANMTVRFVKELLFSMAVMAGKFGGNELSKALEQVQPGMTGMLAQQVWLANATKAAAGGKGQRKAMAVGTSALLSQAEPLLQDSAGQVWGQLVSLNLDLLSAEAQQDKSNGPAIDSLADGDHDEDAGYSAGFTKLAFSGADDNDYFREVGDAAVYLAQSLAKLSSSRPGQVAQRAQSTLPPAALQQLQNCLASAQVSLQ